MTFSWSPPAPTLRNGVITGYSLLCVPEAGQGNSISMQYTAAGTFTLGGFTPFISYNCSISASNSQGNGPAAYGVVVTLDDCEIYACIHNTVVSRKYAPPPPFCNLSLSTKRREGGAYTRDATFSLAIMPPPPLDREMFSGSVIDNTVCHVLYYLCFCGWWFCSCTAIRPWRP